MVKKRRPLSGIVLDEHTELDLCQLCEVCGVDAERVIEMVGEGVVAPSGTAPHQWCFTGIAVIRVRTALRLQRDLRVNLAGAALALDLLEELAELRRLRDRWFSP
jgi:chaperone modulatory protein CbpM